MRATGMSVPEAVRELITRNRSIYDCIKMDVINYTALAVRVQPEVERMLGVPVNLNTVVVAIKRYADSFEKAAGEEDRESVLKNARLVLTDGMMGVRFSTEEFDRLDPAKILDKFAKMGGDYDFFRLSDSFRFLAEDMKGVREIFGGAGGGGTYSTGLAKIKVVISDARGSPSDAVSYVAEVLHAAGIELVNAYFGQDSISIIVREKDAARAYDTLHTYIARG